MRVNEKQTSLRFQKNDRLSKTRVPLPAAADKYLAGPIPLEWLEAAGRGAGHTLHVGIALWYQARLTKTAVVTLPKAFLDGMEIDRFAVSRGLKALERAGLVSVERAAGRKPVVTILSAPATPYSTKEIRGISQGVLEE